MRAFGQLAHNPAAGRVEVHAPGFVEPDPADLPLVRRIFESYRRMKADQRTAGGVYLPSSLWQQQLDSAYSSLNEGLERDDLAPFHHFLANFGAWERYTGVTWSTLIRGSAGSALKRRHLENEVFLRQARIWQWFYGGRRPIAALRQPAHGNQLGAHVDGEFLTVSSFPIEVYGNLLAQLLDGHQRPVVAELGGGYGIQAYYLLSQRGPASYVDFDLPETLCLAAYYLAKCFPERRLLLYGEADYSPALHEEYDLLFMPSFVMERLASDSVTLFVNEFSLGEMTSEAARNFVSHIARSAEYFFHVNHDRVPNVYGGDARGLLGFEYPVPADRFVQLFRYPELFHMINRGFLNFSSDTFAYLYGRRLAHHGE